jgi:hypothetical protein
VIRSPARRHRAGAVAAAVAVALAAAGCSAGDARPPTAAPPAAAAPDASADWDTTSLPDPCRLLRPAEVAAAFGGPVAPGVRIAEWPPFCQYPLDRHAHAALDLSTDSRPDASAGFEQHKTAGGAVDPVAGLGDDAYWLPATATLHVLAGPTHLCLALRSDTRPPAGGRAHLVALARLALRRSH